MTYFMSVTFCSTNDSALQDLRPVFAGHLRKMNLRYKSDIYYPESSWSTPAFGEPEELTFLIGVPKQAQVNYLEVDASLRKLAEEVKALFPPIEKMYTEFLPPSSSERESMQLSLSRVSRHLRITSAAAIILSTLFFTIMPLDIVDISFFILF